MSACAPLRLQAAVDDGTRDLSTFIRDLAFSGMPVRFLRDVATSNYTITNLGLSSRVLPSLNTMLLDTFDLEAMSIAISDPNSASRAVTNIYHEATHAWLDLNRELQEVRTLRQRGVPHYRKAPVEHDAPADPERLFEEAIGKYVGQRATARKQDRTTRELGAEMKSFADARLLENKIPDLFVQTTELANTWDELTQLLRHPHSASY